MEKKPRRSEAPKTPKTQPLQKIIGNSKLQINEDEASGLIGSIVEKGMSDGGGPSTKPFAPTPAPMPSVLPFPVARHRSHGPHWDPITTTRRIGDDADINDDDHDEDMELAAAEQAAALAGPVQRKEKKGLDLSHWRELLPSKDSSNGKRIREPSHVGARSRANGREGIVSADRRIAEQDSTSFKPVTGASKSMDSGLGSATGRQVTNRELDNGGRATTPGIDTSFRNYAEPVIIENQGGEDRMEVDDSGNSQSNLSLESQIDEENQARLGGMTPDEIAEAQAELVGKMDPALLEVLKRRGLEKSKKNKKNLSDASVVSSGKSGSPTVDNRSNADSHLLTTTSSKGNNNTPGNILAENKGPSGSTLWSAWSDKVEGVRNLRFSLDGNIVGSDPGPVSSTNSAFSQSADNVSGRDFLRTEGDPGAAGYTIKEAVALSRSVVPGQRSLALNLLASVLDKAIRSIAQDQVGIDLAKVSHSNNGTVDWKAVWAFALGPEPELVLSLRMSLDDNHNSVVLACAKVIQCILSCDINEHFFDYLENMDMSRADVYTAPVFRHKPEIDVGFLHGGFWKYSAKSSNLFPFGETADEETEGNHTIQDDIVIAGQDFAAGLIRMGILPRIRYLLETDPSLVLEERLISILVAIARHSPRGANAIMECPRLVQAVVNRFTSIDNFEINQSKIKSVTLLKVLARSDRRICKEFVRKTIQAVTWHLNQPFQSLDQWMMSGKESCRLSAALMVEQLRLWKVCISYGFCVSNFSDIFRSICLWLNPPTISKLLERDMLREFTSISKEAYLVLGAFASRLPDFHLQMLEKGRDPEVNTSDNKSDTLPWSYVGPMVDLGLKWILLKSDAQVSELFELGDGSKNNLTSRDKAMTSSLLWVYSAVLQMFSAVLQKLDPKNTSGGRGRPPWLPDFVPRIGLELIKNGFLGSVSCDDSVNNGSDKPQVGSFLKELCYLRLKSKSIDPLACVCCLHVLVEVGEILDKVIHLAKSVMSSPPTEGLDISREGKILEKGILKASLPEIRSSLEIFLNLVTSEWQYIQSIETFGRGGPAPGVGVGWGASGGGFWSTDVLLAQKDAGFLTYLLQIADVALDVDQALISIRINAALGACLVYGPRDKTVVEKTLDFLLQVPILQYLSNCIRKFAALNRSSKLVMGEYTEEDFLLFSNLLLSHFKNRWLNVKKTKDAGGGKGSVDKAQVTNSGLETIHEDMDIDESANDGNSDSLVVEWAHQRLPLPVHWFLSPISTIGFAELGSNGKISSKSDLGQDDLLAVAKAGIFFSLGLEAMSNTQLSSTSSVVKSVPLVWKFHSLSMVLLVGMDVLEDEKTRFLYETLQDLLGKQLDQARSDRGSCEVGKEQDPVFALRFQSEIHDSYPTFIETLVEHFGAVSYGDSLYGRQVAIHLHRHVEAPVRLATWNALSTARVLELLPRLEECLAAPEGYLEPAEDDEGMLEAYVKSWTSGTLDRAATRKSLAITLFLHHISSFLFLNDSRDKVLLRNKLVKSLLRDYSRKHQHEGLMLDLIRYKGYPPPQLMEQEGVTLCDTRFHILTEACEGNVSLLKEVEKLRSAFLR